MLRVTKSSGTEFGFKIIRPQNYAAIKSSLNFPVKMLSFVIALWPDLNAPGSLLR
ncbi:hypothetical protein L0128_17245 [candidate division KSB1 bacterium]|nr:hypothetical protein [candidate division KSB1 bacterium]